VSAAVVRWDNMLSGTIQLMCGVRQGGVLSPVLFAVYVNDNNCSTVRIWCRLLLW